ncbi:probable asparagine--tRNA ligase, mitochondrial isoform X2 [Physella acuta]|uniref:probable asparagine--tRNA ligase, mitochondrial isoform X2 n=1 Tax=Physella acuta TaxID=109671 RepID=UPI0027DDE7F7|nr:probable asparagine--tRNA ligase, mitochondrial isoform X2 [Physella acuta]
MRDIPAESRGWVKNLQHHKGVTFLQINDGSGPNHLQVVIPQKLAKDAALTFGSCVKVDGVLKESEGRHQEIELLTSSCVVVGPCDVFEYPLKQKTRHPPAYTRDFLHLRPKTNIFSSLLRIRNAATMAVHSFFQEKNFILVHPPILTSSDCEGACEVFTVEPLNSDLLKEIQNESENLEHKKKDSILDPARPNNFFRQPTYLTVSGQLHLEIMTGAFTKVYSFGPTFRAENTIGSFHLSEFYMVEAELAFIQNMDALSTVMEQLVKYIFNAVLKKCPEDVEIFSKNVADPEYMKKVKNIMESNYERMTYTEAIALLENSDEKFDYPCQWGCDLKKEHEMYLTKAVGNLPVFITDYPADIKPFYARRNDDGLTVSALDLLVPGIGELCGSSLREERAEILESVMKKQNLVELLPWYLELRKFGSCPHGGFGLGFERLLQVMLGVESIKDVIPFPRWPNNCKT